MNSTHKRENLVYCLFLAFTCPSFGQDLSYDFQPARNFKPSVQLIDEYITRFSAWGDKGITSTSKVKATFKKFIEQKTEFIIALDSLGILIYGDSMSNLLERIKDKIAAGNPNLKREEIRIFIYRSLEPNAFSLGEGLLLVSTGLLARMPHVDQVAFVLSHELAHDAMRHVYSNLQRISESLHDERLKKSFQKASRKKEGRNTQINNFVTNFIAIHMAYSQQNEFDADSIGLVYFQNAGFPISGAVDALRVLDSADYLLYEDTLDLRHYFNFSEYPFKSYWLDTENSALHWEKDTLLFVIPDSLKSHPDCDERIQRIRNFSTTSMAAVLDVSTEELAMDRLKDVFRFESLESQIMSRDYVMALYLSLQFQTQFSENIYLKSVTTHALIELAAAFSRNEFLEYVEFADRDYPAGYNQMLTFLHNMNSSTLYKLASYCLQEKLASVSDHAYIGFLKVLNDNRDGITEDIVSLYAQQYRDEYFIDILKAKTEFQMPAPKK